MQAVKSRNLFDSFTISPCSCFRYNFDGPTGRRVLFIESEEKYFTLSFEEGMSCLDIRNGEKRPYTEAEYKNGKGYIHQLRIGETSNFVFFHFEYHDSRGKTYLLPGQMRGKEGYTWSESEVEPILVEIMNSITLKEEAKSSSACYETDFETEKTLWQKIKKCFLEGGK
ncbi:MAG: hypothetical protein IJO24_02440 [Clostridia bacterium]|nr:hypothetical protein [Clostridia bacterium]